MDFKISVATQILKQAESDSDISEDDAEMTTRRTSKKAKCKIVLCLPVQNNYFFDLQCITTMIFFVFSQLCLFAINKIKKQ